MLKGYILTYPECILDETQPAFDLLQMQYQVSYIELEQVHSELEADFLLIPGGSCDLCMDHKNLRLWIQKLHTQNKIIGGICNGALVMADSGILDNKICTHTAHPSLISDKEKFKELLEAAEKVFKHTTFVNEDVVSVDNLTTAKPWAAEAFAQNIGLKLSKIKK